MRPAERFSGTRAEKGLELLPVGQVSASSERGRGEGCGGSGNVGAGLEILSAEDRGEKGPMKDIAAARRVDDRDGKRGLVNDGSAPFAKPTAMTAFGDSGDPGSPLSEPDKLIFARSGTDGAVRELRRDDEEIDEWEEFRILFIKSMGPAVEGDEAPRRPHDPGGLDTSRPVAAVEMEDAAGFKQTARQFVG